MRITKSLTSVRFRRLSGSFAGAGAPAPRERSVISGPPHSSTRVPSARPAPGPAPSGRHPGSGPVGAHEARPGRFLDAAPGDQDEVTGRAVPPPVHLSQQALGPRPLNGASDLAARHHPKTGRRTVVTARPLDRHQVRGDASRSSRHHGPELGGPRNSLIPPQRLGAAGAGSGWTPMRSAVFTHDGTPERIVRAGKGARNGRMPSSGRQPSTAPATPTGDDRAAARTAHPCPETVLPLPPPPIGLKRPFHGSVLSKSLNLQEKPGGRRRCRHAAPPSPTVYRQTVFRVK